MKNVPIVIAAYNRSGPLGRLLKSVNKGMYPDKVKLIISIDGGDNADVISLAENFYWEHGEKEIIRHKTNIGLRNHILSCGDLTYYYDGIILLEDDLYVSPFFYIYTMQAMKFYRDDEMIAGISLYSHRYNETAMLPFVPLTDDSDVFFLQIASSWGQAWTKKQWMDFRVWYNKPGSLRIDENTILPYDVMRWPETSWKKYFIKYIVESDLFFVYPKQSLATNFGDNGMHHKGTDKFQVALQYNKMEYRFKKTNESMLKYDSFCDILPNCFNKLTPILKDYNYVVDLYGIKPPRAFSGKYVLTTRCCTNPILSFGRQLIPCEANVIENIAGQDIYFALRDDVSRSITSIENIQRLQYYYRIDDTVFNLLNKELVQVGRQLSETLRELDAVNKSMKMLVGKILLWPFLIIRRAIEKWQMKSIYK